MGMFKSATPSKKQQKFSLTSELDVSERRVFSFQKLTANNSVNTGLMLITVCVIVHKCTAAASVCTVCGNETPNVGYNPKTNQHVCS